MNIDNLQQTLNALKKKRARLKEAKDEAYRKWEADPTEENLQKFESLRQEYRKTADSVHRTRNKLQRSFR